MMKDRITSNYERIIRGRPHKCRKDISKFIKKCDLVDLIIIENFIVSLDWVKEENKVIELMNEILGKE